MTDKVIGIDGLSKADVLAILYNLAIAKGDRIKEYDPSSMTPENARRYLEGHGSEIYIERIKGRALKVDLTSDLSFDATSYDIENGNGAADIAVSSLRMDGSVNPDVVKMLHRWRMRRELVEIRASDDSDLSDIAFRKLNQAEKVWDSEN